MYKCDIDYTKDDTRPEEDDTGSRIIPSRTEYGKMIDFLRANTWCTADYYKWSMTVAQINLASCDYSRIEYDTNKKDNTTYIDSVDDLKGLTDFGTPILTPKKQKDDGR